MSGNPKLQINSDATDLEMAEAIFGDGIEVVSASYTGGVSASGIYQNGDTDAPDITPADKGVILSTGKASDVTSGGDDVNVKPSKTTEHETDRDSDLDSVSGQTTYDAAILEAEFVPEGSTLTMQIVFASEEYLEYVNSGFNDAVGIWVNEEPAELMVGSGAVSIDNINDSQNANLYRDNSQNDDTFNTEMDGFTVTLTLKAVVNPGEINTIKIGIADGGDSAYDSNLLIAGDSVQTALVAGDDNIEVERNSQVTANLLENDTSSASSILTITHINGQPVSIGDTVELASGEIIELTDDGIILLSSGVDLGTTVFSYTVGDGAGNTDVGFVNLTTVPCFVSGASIVTDTGPRPVDALSVGDRVLTKDHGYQAIRWIGTSERIAQGKYAPVELAAGTLGAKEALRVSPQHCLLIRSPMAELFFEDYEVFARAKDLADVGLATIRAGRFLGRYFHILFDEHKVITANGVLTESFLPGPETVAGLPLETMPKLQAHLNHNSCSLMRSARKILKSYEVRVLYGNNGQSFVSLAA